MIDSATEQTLFSLDDGDETELPAAPVPPRGGLHAARATLATTNSPDMSDPERHPRLLLVVDCPFCDHVHIHPGGHVSEPRVCLRRSRCVGRPGGAYYFPEVQHR